MRKALAGIAALVIAFGVIAFAAAVATAGPSANFEFATDPDVGISGPPGTLYHVAGIATPAEMIGRECHVTVSIVNNESRRPGTGFIVSSNRVNLLVDDDIEATSGSATYEAGDLVLGEFVNAWVLFGPKGEASVDGSVSVVCPDAPVPPETPPSITVPPTANVAVRPVPVAAPPSFTG